MVTERTNAMRVLHLVKTSVGATWALRQINELMKLGAEVHVALPAAGPMLPKYRDAGAIVHGFNPELPIKEPWRFRSVMDELRQLVANINPDIIHSHFVSTTLALRLALGKSHPIPRVFQIPGPLHLEHTFFRWTDLNTAGSNDYWIGSCNWTCQRYKQAGISPERIFLSYYGIDIESFSRQQCSGKLRQEIGVDNETPLIGMVAYMYAPKWYLGQSRGLKGHEDLIDALVLCRKQHSEITGVFIGGAWNNALSYEQHVHQYAQARLGDAGAVFLGTRNDVSALYPDLNMVVHPSHSENVGGAGESLLMGVPTIATHVGGFPDVVIPGKTGWLVPPRSPERLSQTILEVLHNSSEAKIRALDGQKLIRKMMDIKKNASEIFGIYQTILQNQ